MDWLIVGGGLHGVHLAARLIGEAGFDTSRLRIVDPGKCLLSRWRNATQTIGMTHLRSSSVHHLDICPRSLRQFARKGKGRRKVGLFAPPYDRPALSLFDAHCDEVINKFELSKIHIKARAKECFVDDEAVTVGISNGQKLTTQYLVLAVGASEQPVWPRWALKNNSRIQHIFELESDKWPKEPEVVVVVGGGISAAQVALRLIKEGHEVHQVSRHSLRQHQFDSDPGWLGPKLMDGFIKEQSLVHRRAIIKKARHKGSVPAEVRQAIQREIRRRRMHWHESSILGFVEQASGLQVQLNNDSVIDAHRVLLATGFTSTRPGGAMIDRLVASAALPCAPCGYPVVDSSLRWHPRVYVTGPLAELELGPTARNIVGARRAGDRLLESVRRNNSIRGSDQRLFPERKVAVESFAK